VGERDGFLFGGGGARVLQCRELRWWWEEEELVGVGNGEIRSMGDEGGGETRSIAVSFLGCFLSCLIKVLAPFDGTTTVTPDSPNASSSSSNPCSSPVSSIVIRWCFATTSA